MLSVSESRSVSSTAAGSKPKAKGAPPTTLVLGVPVSDDFEITAWTEHADGAMDEIMGLRHKRLRIEGVQFHPESILTEHGHDMLKNFLDEK